MTDLFTVPVSEMHSVYPKIAGELDRAIAIAGDRYADGEIERDLKNGDRQLWLVMGDDKIQGTVVTRVYKTGVCQVELCAGYGLDGWLDHLDEIEDWAWKSGWVMEVVGRPGWSRKLKPRGYKLVGVILRKE